MPRSWSRLDRYVAREIRAPLLLGLAAFSMIFLINQLFAITRQVIEKQVPLSLILGFVGAEIPSILRITLPMSILLAVLIGIGRMNAQNEVIVLRTAGISALRLFRPVLLVAALLFGAAAFTTHYLDPWAWVYQDELFDEINRARDPNREIDAGVFYQQLENAVFYAREVADSTEGPVQQGTLLLLESPRDEGLSELILARKSQTFFERDTGRISLLLDEGELHSWDPTSPETYTLGRFENLTRPFPPSPFFGAKRGSRGEKNPRFKAGYELPALIHGFQEELATAKNDGQRSTLRYRIRAARVVWHERWALPAAIPVLAFLAFPLAVRTRRGGRFAGLAQAILVIFVYYLLLSIGDGLTKPNEIPAWVGQWIPVAVCFLWAVVLWTLLALRERGRMTAGIPETIARLTLFFLRRRPARPVRDLTGHHRSESRNRGVRLVPLSRMDVYLASGYLRMFLAVMLILVALTAAVDASTAADRASENYQSIPWGDVFTYVVLSIPVNLRHLFPIAALAAALISLTSLARAGEIVALKASGIGPVRIVAPLVAATVLISGSYAAIQETLLPSAQHEAKKILHRLKGETAADESRSGRQWIFGDEGHLWAYSHSRAKWLASPGLFRVNLDRARLLERIEAREARLEDGKWVFIDGWRRTFSERGVETFDHFQRLPTQLTEDPALFGATKTLFLGSRLADEKTFKELLEHLRRMSQAGFDSSALLVGLHTKIVIPLLPILLLIVGAPMAVSGWSRRGGLYGFGLALIITFVFWAIWSASTALGRDGLLAPILAAWLPPALLLLTGGFLMLRAR